MSALALWGVRVVVVGGGWWGVGVVSSATMAFMSRSPVSCAPSSCPLALVESSHRLTHQQRLVDESTPTRGGGRARPNGMQRAVVFVALTAPGQPAPNDPREYRSIGSITRGEARPSFESGKGGMQAHDLSRWVSASAATGPWSDTTSATVAA